MTQIRVYRTIVDVERSHRNLAKGYHSHEVLLKSDKKHEEIVLKSDYDELTRQNKILREALSTTGHHLSSIEHSIKRYTEVGKDSIALVKIMPEVTRIREALKSTEENV